jgi:hypothetical protein
VIARAVAREPLCLAMHDLDARAGRERGAHEQVIERLGAPFVEVGPAFGLGQRAEQIAEAGRLESAERRREREVVRVAEHDDRSVRIGRP